MKIALAQIDITIGDFEGTLKKAAEFVARAKKAGASLIAFPELTTAGYPPRDLVEVPSFVENNLRALKEIAKSARGIAVVVGYVEKNPKKGKPLYNAAALCENGKVRSRYFKQLLPTYDVFDEGRYFEPGVDAGIWSFQKTKIGISICEDIWSGELSEKKLYVKDPIAAQVKKGAKFLLNISSSPYSLGKEKQRLKMLGALARKYRRPVAYVNLVGGNDELVFDGRSVVFDGAGHLIAQGKAYEEDLVIVDLGVDLKAGKKIAAAEMEPLESVYWALVLGLKDYAAKCGFQKAVLGLSGGIDSALTAAIAVEALGAKNVIGVCMPSLYSSEGSLKDSRELGRSLEIKVEEYSISQVYDLYRQFWGSAPGDAPDLSDENLQARIRGTLLMSLSNRHGWLVLSTGNKSELAVGYCTLYGDMNGGMAVISDLPKTMVYDLCRWLNRKKGKRLISEAILMKAPSAELRPNQTDQDSLPPYEILDPILKMIVEDHKSEKEIVKKGFDPETVKRIISLVHKNEYKRRQAAVGIKVTSKAFGIGRRFPVARKI